MCPNFLSVLDEVCLMLVNIMVCSARCRNGLRVTSHMSGGSITRNHLRMSGTSTKGIAFINDSVQAGRMVSKRPLALQSLSRVHVGFQHRW